MTFPSRHPAVRRWAGATAVVLAGSLSLVACGTADDPVPASGGTKEPTRTRSPSPSDEPTAEPTSQEPEEPTDTAVPVYFVGDGPGGKPRLFREFHRVTGDPLLEAARLVAGGGQPDDPDYRTLWPQVEISSVGASDGLLVVSLPSDDFTERPDGMTRRDATLALQQLVYTLQGVQQERVPVLVERGGSDVRLFGVPTDVPLEAASALRTLNLVNITSPAEGDTVTGDTLTVTGVANSFEASGPCRLIAGGEEVSLEGYQADGWMEDRLFPFEVELPLDGVTGDVVVRCETDDPSGGAEGDGPNVDTKLVTVQ
ncbi:Gmad2 immunoglobulin-like domain-containing protein [Nocardioides sp.]|uniref:Gmad2 immunoglobulin-like domain-containing protein n=1 Tax=Nocardioides sp. TaxID=35761 RepID=UPI002614B918|nr:Gmad2 immunoglobulin-like domain-containing protein [Nocardioides sp.]MCW2735648.1 Immunoglobulin-like domain of spore germination [Nocardioides sp.]